MRIAICGTYGLPARYGGFETCVEETATRLAAWGHHVEVFGPRLPGQSAGTEYRGVRVRRNPTIHTKHLTTLVQTTQAVGQCIRRRPDLVHLYIVGNAPLLVGLRRAGIPTALSVDGLEWRRAKWGAAARLYFRVCERLAVTLAGELITDSRFVSNYYRRRYGRPGTYVPYGTFTAPPVGPSPLPRLDLRPGGYLLFVGRLTPEKNVHQLLAAFTRVRTDRNLVIVGDDPFSRDYVARLKATSDPRVRFVGYVYGDECLHLFANAYLYVTASRLEGTSPALLTAMGQGCCPVVNGIPENRETIGDAGVASRENDPRDLARCLQRLVADPALVARLGARARARAERVYNWETVTRKLERIYRALGAEGAAR